jgi:hypothetical protein
VAPVIRNNASLCVMGIAFLAHGPALTLHTT